MLDNLDTEYLAKFRALEKTTTALEETLKTIYKGAIVLGNKWGNTAPPTCPPSQQDPIKIAEFFSTNNWPDKEHIINLVSQWHQENQGLKEIYDQIPPERRSALPPPE